MIRKIEGYRLDDGSCVGINRFYDRNELYSSLILRSVRLSKEAANVTKEAAAVAKAAHTVVWEFEGKEYSSLILRSVRLSKEAANATKEAANAAKEADAVAKAAHTVVWEFKGKEYRTIEEAEAERIASRDHIRIMRLCRAMRTCSSDHTVIRLIKANADIITKVLENENG